MKIRIEDLPPEGIEVEVAEGEPWARTAATEALEGPADSVSGRLHVMRVGTGVHVSGRARARVARTCDRCLAPVRVEVGGVVALYYDVYRPDEEKDVRLGVDDLDIGFYDGEVIDLGTVLSEFFALELPGRLRCGDEAVSRLEEGECEVPRVEGAAEEEGDPRFQVLRGLKLER